MKRYARYQMDFTSRYVRWSGLCMAASLFLLIVYYLGIENLEDYSLGAELVKLWIPLILGAAYLVLLQMLRWNAPGLYAVLTALFCLMMFFGVFTSDSVARIVLGVLAYPICGFMMIAAVAGYLPGLLPATICFGVLIAGRVLFDMGQVSGAAWVDTLSAFCQLLSLMFLPMGMKRVPLRETAK